MQSTDGVAIDWRIAPTEAPPHPSPLKTIGQQVKSAVYCSRGQGRGVCFDTVQLCKHFETGGTEKFFFLSDGRRSWGGLRLRASRSSWLPVIRLRWKGIVCVSRTAVFVFNLQTRTETHSCAHTFACSEQTQTHSLTYFSSTERWLNCTHFFSQKATHETMNLIVGWKTLQWCYTDRKGKNIYHCKTVKTPWGHFLKMNYWIGYTHDWCQILQG